MLPRYVPIRVAFEQDAMHAEYESLLGQLDVTIKQLDAALKSYHDALVEVDLIPDTDTTLDTMFRKHQGRVQDGIDSMLRHWDEVDYDEAGLRSAIVALTRHGKELLRVFGSVAEAIEAIEKADAESLETRELSHAFHELQAVLRESAEDFYLSLSDLGKRNDTEIRNDELQV